MRVVSHKQALEAGAKIQTSINTTLRVRIGGLRTIADVLGASGLTHIDRSILERCSLKQGGVRWATIEIFSIDHLDYDPTDEEIEAEYMRHGLKRPDVDHAIHFGDQHRNLPMGGRPVVFYLKDPIPFAHGDRRVLSFRRRGANRELNWSRLYPDIRWRRGCLFAGVRE